MSHGDTAAPAHAEAKQGSVAFILPCLNEAKTIEWCVRRALAALEKLAETHGLKGEVIVADNGSDDGSQALARAAGARVVDVPARGYGAALKGGFDAATADYLVMGDSDCSYDFLEAVPMVERLMAGADFCMGSRFKGEIKPGAMPWKNRYIGNPALSGILRMLFDTKISDAHCGLRAIRADAYRSLNLSSTGMEFASEMVLKSVLQDLRIDEVPITLSPDQRDRKPHLNPWRDGLRHLAFMLLLSPRHLFFWPAIALMVFGVCVFAVLMFADTSGMATLGPFRFGDHFAVAASAAIILAVQTAITGMFATIYSVQQGYRNASARLIRLFRYSRLEGWIGIGLILCVAGLVGAGAVVVSWVASDFSELRRMRDLILSATLIVSGIQIIFSGFLMSIFAGNRSTHARSLDLDEGRAQRPERHSDGVTTSLSEADVSL